MKWEPLDYQAKGVEILVEKQFTGLLLKPGMRKTSISLAAYTIMKDLGMTKGMLVFAPLRVCYTAWPQEIQKWDEFKHLSIGILHGPKKNEVLKEKHDVYVINYEGIPWLYDQLMVLPAKQWPFDMLIFDESTKVKNTRGVRYNLLKPMIKFFKRRVILTGSPTARNLLDLFGQCYMMDMGKTFGNKITSFRKEYFRPADDGGHVWVPKAGTEGKIFDIMSPRVFYAHDEDYLNLPPFLEKNIEVDLPPDVLKMYKEFEATLKLEFMQGKVTAANSGVKTGKLRQIANGGVYLDGQEKAWKQLHNVKTEAVCDLVEELSGQPALITYEYRHDLARLQEALRALLGEDVPFVGKGGVKPKDMQGLIKAWNRYEVPAIIVSPSSMAHGVDGLQEAGKAVIWHSLTHNYEEYDQLNRRLKRSGQTERVLLAHIITRRTVDLAIMASNGMKEGTQNRFFKALKEYWASESADISILDGLKKPKNAGLRGKKSVR